MLGIGFMYLLILVLIVLGEVVICELIYNRSIEKLVNTRLSVLFSKKYNLRNKSLRLKELCKINEDKYENRYAKCEVQRLRVDEQIIEYENLLAYLVNQRGNK